MPESIFRGLSGVNVITYSDGAERTTETSTAPKAFRERRQAFSSCSWVFPIWWMRTMNEKRLQLLYLDIVGRRGLVYEVASGEDVNEAVVLRYLLGTAFIGL